MLYDPKWEKQAETKADPLTLGAVVAWLEKQPANNIYCYGDEGHCLAAQYNKSIGREYRVASLTSPYCFDVALEQIAVSSPRTFGAALERARAELRS